jgi:prepilin-type N-terminal cleavage/methylation domain-containing protein
MESKMDMRNEKGFTLLEVVVAGAILAIGLLGIAGMMTNSVRGNDFGKRLTTAEYLAQQRIEQFRNLSYINARDLEYPTTAPPYNKTLAGCGADADPEYPTSDIDYDKVAKVDDPDDNAFEYEAYGYEDYGQITDPLDETITYPQYRRETLLEAGRDANNNGCASPYTDRTANLTVIVKWKGITGERSVKVMSMLSK